MVHKVTMDTVRVITSSVSGMTNVSEPHPPAPGPVLMAGAHASSPHCAGLGDMVLAQNSAALLLPFSLPGMAGGP